MKRRGRPRAHPDTIFDMEIEANYFAMCLLVPTGLLKEELAKTGGTFDLCDDDALKALAKKFGVSMMVMTIRLKEVIEEMWIAL